MLARRELPETLVKLDLRDPVEARVKVESPANEDPPEFPARTDNVAHQEVPDQADRKDLTDHQDHGAFPDNAVFAAVPDAKDHLAQK